MSDQNDDAVSHYDIITRGGGPAEFSRKVGQPLPNVKAWSRNNSIPGGYWRRIVDEGLASYRELAEAAERRAAA